MKKTLLFVRKHWKSMLWIAFILYGTLTPSQHLPKSRLLEVNYSDLVIHFFLWAIMMFLLLWEMNYSKLSKKQRRKHAFIALYVCLGLGFFSELAQHLFIASRSGNIFDFVADSLGAAVIYLVLFFWKRKKIAYQH